MIKLITFDLDNTLWDADPVVLAAEQACWTFLVEHYPNIESIFTKLTLRHLKFELADEIPALAHRVSEIRRYCLEQALVRAGYSQKQAELGSQEAFKCFIKVRQHVSLYPDALAMLNALSSTYRLAALTNGNADLSVIGLDCFEFALNAEHFDGPKPEPFIFQAALEKTGVSAEQVLHIGDHSEHDVFGAHRLGMHTLWFNQHSEDWPRNDCRPHLEVSRLSQIPDLITAYCDGLG